MPGNTSVTIKHGRGSTAQVADQVYRVDYEPAESSSGLFGGNSNWRGPIWFPVNLLMIRALISMYAYYGADP